VAWAYRPPFITFPKLADTAWFLASLGRPVELGLGARVFSITSLPQAATLVAGFCDAVKAELPDNSARS
jgi:hypothetical protein